MTTSPSSQRWAPAACTLPTGQQTLRLAEFDALFAGSVRDVRRVGSTSLLLTLAGDEGLADTARELARRESDCCSFFRFSVTRPAPTVVALLVHVPPAHTAVLDRLATRALALQ